MAAKYEIFKGSNSDFRFRLKAGNGEKILRSEGYGTKQACINGIESVRKNALIDGRYDRKKSTNDKYYFTLKGGNGEPIGTSEMYESNTGMETGISSVKLNGPTAPVEDLTI